MSHSGDSNGESVGCAEGFAGLHGTIGAHSSEHHPGLALDDATPAVRQMDIRGKSHITVAVSNAGPNAAALVVTWYWGTKIGKSAAPVAIPPAPAAAVIIDWTRSADIVEVTLSTAQGETAVCDLQMGATH